MITSALFITVCFLAYANGANDNFKGVATLFGSGMSNYRSALGLASIATLAGSICALFLAQTLMVKFSGKGLASDTLIHSPSFMIAVAGGAGLTVILATRFGFPISTTHALLGAIVGSTFLATQGNLHLTPLLDNFVLPLILSPFIALLLAALAYQILHKLSPYLITDPALCLCIEQPDEIALTDFSNRTLLLDVSEQRAAILQIDQQTACAQRNTKRLINFNTTQLLNRLHYISAGSVCFARGLNDTPKIAALLLLAPAFNLQWIIIIIAFTMLLGGLFNARRVAETMSHKITSLTSSQGLSANLTTALLVIFASHSGMPVSTTHVSVGALFGIGLTSDKANTGVILSIALSWLLTLPCAAACSAIIYTFSTHFTNAHLPL